jgi:SAM-dependent methyltransferase
VSRALTKPWTSDSSRLRWLKPVFFQPLEDELASLVGRISGRVLNAGCGNRDLTGFLKKSGAAEVVNYDIASSIPGAIIGSLVDMPFEDGGFDTILCNAVLEHVPDIATVMAELARVLKPGGVLIAGVPFLQPFHRSPTDYRRYTRDGLVELGEMHGFKTYDVLPVHNIVQTVGWILWEWAKEKRGLRPILVYPVVFIATRFFSRTDFALRNNANTFQAIYLKPSTKVADR